MFKVPAEHAISKLKNLIDDLGHRTRPLKEAGSQAVFFYGSGLEDLFAYVYGTAVRYDEDADELTFIPLEGREEDYEAAKEVMLAGLSRR